MCETVSKPASIRIRVTYSGGSFSGEYSAQLPPASASILGFVAGVNAGAPERIAAAASERACDADGEACAGLAPPLL